MPLKINTEAFAKVPENLVDPAKPNIKKYNIRMHNTEVAVIVALDTWDGVTTSQIFKKLV